MTTAAGCPVADIQNSITAGAHGPVVLRDLHLFEKLAHMATLKSLAIFQNANNFYPDPKYWKTDLWGACVGVLVNHNTFSRRLTP